MSRYLDLARRALNEKRSLPESSSCKQGDEDVSFPEPYFRENGSLVIPSNSNPRYHWWNGGLSIQETIREIRRKNKTG
ncbi:MAG: hypothetical protein G3M78_05200 [Candidatus Nitrohelix vancouverensis]|uniref:Uncharacterized protein n=1 Tax=Candidatus Nitrohelix vancouverensis TaxID=2705534 RepID=A0A7T0C1H4_9BACT|nr:MAG: hypothetical protein G3M78_05200 [Candidatus Nitrohelix vancouverensis]